MKRALLDVNAAVYLIDADSPSHDAVQRWWSDARNDGWHMLFADPVIVGTLRVLGLPSYAGVDGTRQGAAWFDQVLALTDVRKIEASSGAYAWFRAMIDEMELGGNDIPDAYLAGMAMDAGAALVTADRGFDRFPGLQVVDPTG
ncbi:MAG: TA system VapC family ribonuclease toxin [Actinomycetota bacterium]